MPFKTKQNHTNQIRIILCFHSGCELLQAKERSLISPVYNAKLYFPSFSVHLSIDYTPNASFFVL